MGCSATGRRTSKVWSIYAEEFCFLFMKSEIVPCRGKWVELEMIGLDEHCCSLPHENTGLSIYECIHTCGMEWSIAGNVGGRREGNGRDKWIIFACSFTYGFLALIYIWTDICHESRDRVYGGVEYCKTCAIIYENRKCSVSTILWHALTLKDGHCSAVLSLHWFFLYQYYRLMLIQQIYSISLLILSSLFLSLFSPLCAPHPCLSLRQGSPVLGFNAYTITAQLHC